MTYQVAWIGCDEIGCTEGATVSEPRHLDNLRAPGEWYCPRHNRRGGDTDAA